MEHDKKLRSEVPLILEEVLLSYKRQEKLQKLGHYAVPSRDTAARLLEDLETILFPGYAGRQDIDAVSLPHYIGGKIDGVYHMLAEQISRCWRHECRTEHETCDSCRRRGEQHAVMFLKKIPAIRDCLQDDLLAAYEGDPAAKDLDEIIFCYPGFKAITIHRIAHELYAQGVPVLPRIMSEYAHSETGIDIHPGAGIGRRFFIDHGTGVVIGETTVIGDNVRIYQGVTLGALSVPRGGDINKMRAVKRHPTIEDNVTIYAEATVLGDTTVGRDSVVGGNVWLTQSVPPGTRVINEPPMLKYVGRKDAERAQSPDFQI